MDAKNNPFAPGAGTPPPELAGRSGTIADADVAIARAKNGRPAKSQLLLGLRGVGKTVLLNRIQTIASTEGCLVVSLEAPEDRRLAEMLIPPLRSALFRLSTSEKARDAARSALATLRAFAAACKVKVGDVEFGIEPAVGSADSGNLEFDLPALMLSVAGAAKSEGRAFVLIIDEVQYLHEEDLAALIVAVHRVGQEGLPFVLFGAGLPQLAALAGDAKSYAERLFDYPDVGPLTEEAATAALREPLKRQDVALEPEALHWVLERTKGYPYFLQEWGYQMWNAAASNIITSEDARLATRQALDRLDKGFFRVRFDRLTPKERDYMRAMASLGPGPHRSGDIAKVLNRRVSEVAPRRTGLMSKGMIYSPQHGDTAFTVPMFDEFMKRTMPNWKTDSTS